MRFDGKRAVITGGASGIGAACAKFLAERGAHIVIADRNLEAAQAIAKELKGVAIAMDVGDDASVENAAEHIETHIGPVDILVNSAGVLQRTLPPGELTMKEWDFVTRIDLRGTYLCCAAFGTRMAARGKGVIVNIASVAGMGSAPLHAYAPAKAGVINLTEGLAGEWGPRGVRVNAVSPGFTTTPALERGFATHTLQADTLVRSAALGRLVEPREIAAAVGFLVSNLASAVTGVNLTVDAGYRAALPWTSYGGLR